MSRNYRYRVVDVFTHRPLEGNPLAVFPDATGLDAVTMQRIARELPPPFMFALPGHGAEVAGMKLADLAKLGFLVFASSISALAFHRAMKQWKPHASPRAKL